MIPKVLSVVLAALVFAPTLHSQGAFTPNWIHSWGERVQRAEMRSPLILREMHMLWVRRRVLAQAGSLGLDWIIDGLRISEGSNRAFLTF